jgi:hypothetical protein
MLEVGLTETGAGGGLEFLTSQIGQVLNDPPPRKIPPGVRSRLFRGAVGGTFWGGLALTNVGALYAVVFFVMGAPWQIPASAAGVGIVGLLLLVVCVVRGMLRVHIFRMGHVTSGVLEQLVKPDSENPGALFGVSTQLVYCFTDSRGDDHRVTTMILWNSRFFSLEPGDSIGILFLPHRPSRNLPLISLV